MSADGWREDARVHELPTTKPTELAASLACDESIVGAFVIVLTRDGNLDLGLAGDEDQAAMKPLLDLVDVVRDHCDQKHKYQGKGRGALTPGN